MTGTPLHVDVFSGIGGWPLAASWAGYATVGLCEIDSFCRKVLAKNFPTIPVHDDVRTLTGEIVRGWTGGGTVDLLTGSWPCQPFSVAGKRRGQDDDRNLWPEMARVVASVQPRWIGGENVVGIVNLALDDCLADLEALGYEAWAVVVPACAVNAPHRRDRVWIIAHVADADERNEPQDGESAAWNGAEEWAGRELSSLVPAGVGASGRTVAGHPPEGVRIGGPTPSGGEAIHPDAADGGPRCRPASWEGGQPAQLRQALSDAERDGREGGGRAAAPARPIGGSGAVADATAPRPPHRGSGQAPGAEPARGVEPERPGGDGGEVDQGRAVDDADGGRHGAPHGALCAGWNGPLDPGGREIEPGVCRTPHGLPEGLHELDRAWGPGWEGGTARVVHGWQPDRVNRLKALGNAIVPSVAYEILKAIRENDR